MAEETNQQRLDKKSTDYLAMQAYWDRTADFMIGEEAVILAGKKYLPLFPDENSEEYDFRKSNAVFTNIWRDNVEGLASKPFEREVSFVDDASVDQRFKDFADDVDGSGNNITIFAMDFFFNAIGFSHDWLFVDYPTVQPRTDMNGNTVMRSVADERAEGVRPYWSRVSVRNVYEVKTQIFKGSERVTYIRIFEPAENQFREMFHDPEADTARFQIWVWNEGKKDYELGPAGPISIKRIPMHPLFTGRRNGKTMQSYPPLKGASDAQLKLYRAESNLEVTKAFAAVPMLVGVGVKPELVNGKPKKLIRGPGITLYAPHTGTNASTDWKFIEPGGTVLTFLSADVDKKKQDVRDLGKQPLTVSSGNLTVITTAVAANKAKSAVKAWAAGLADALTMGMYFTALWWGLDDGPDIAVYDEFDEFLEPGQDIAALLGMRAQGIISSETLTDEMKRRKVLSTDFDFAAEADRLLNDVPNQDTLNDPKKQPPE
jgi:hypothetical protein